MLHFCRIAALVPFLIVLHLSTALWAAESPDGIVRDHPVHALLPGPSVEEATVSDTGWPKLVGDTYVGPVFHDLDSDGTLDVIVVAGNILYVFDHNGKIRDGWPQMSGRAPLPASVGDLDGDDSPDIAVSGGWPTAQIRVYTSWGTVLPGFPVALPQQNDGTCSNPVFVDLDGDGDLEVGAASELGISFFHADGSPVVGWPYTWSSDEGYLTPQWCAPAVGDLDGDGKPEVVVGNKAYPTHGVHVVRANGLSMPGWPKFTNPVWASPALADLDMDGDLEIILKTGDSGYYGHSLYVWHHTGESMIGWPRTICEDGDSSRGSPAVADINGNGLLNIITDTSDGFLHVFNIIGNYLPGWPKHVAEHIMSSPVVIDIDGDGVMEIFVSYWTSFTQYIGGWRLDGTAIQGFPQALVSGTVWKAHSQPHVADLEGDGDLELTVTSFNDYDGWVHMIPIPSGTFNPDKGDTYWPRYRRNDHATGLVPVKGASSIPVNQPPRSRTFLSIWPNPFNPRTMINFECQDTGPVQLAVYDLAGRRVALLVDGWLESGNHERVWNGCDITGRSVAAGQYLVRLKTRDGTDVQKVVLVK